MTNQIINLFKKYGFEYKKNASTEDYMAFTFRSGFFHNAEIVSLKILEKNRIESQMEVAAQDLQKLGFSVKKSFYSSVYDIEKNLFNGFFNVDNWKNKTLSEYNEYCARILNILPKGDKSYSYINVPFLKNDKKIESSIIADICENIQKAGPMLTIVEAPAGFGKTCTSYEIIKTLIEKYNNGPLPFFTEFSRDRQARIFSHILLREVDRNFSAVRSDVVIEEVKQGRIVVVLDGFDEILHDNSSKNEADESFDNAEPMLETISELLVDNAKIILTSRRSAIFDGEMFNDWLSKYDQKFVINRYKLEKPEISDWLSSEKQEKLNKSGVDITKLANPVILSYLSFINDAEFEALCLEPTMIVSQYFNSMLEREMERQQLIMPPDEQTEFLKIIANDMCSKNYTADNKEKLINTIKDKALHLLQQMRIRYSPKDRPTIDKLATTLSNHAFFDRSNHDDSKVEFINEFVFGNYIAEDIITSTEWIASDERFVEPAVLSYAPRSKAERANLWGKLSDMKCFLDKSSKMKYEAILTDAVNELDYNDSEITSINLKHTTVFNVGNIGNSVFNNCTFKDSSINLHNFIDISFLNCQFWDCIYDLSEVEQNNINFYNCRSSNTLPSYEEESVSEEQNDTGINDVQYYILDRIWPSGNNSIERLHHYIGQILKTDKFSKRDIIKGIRKLRQSGYLTIPNNVNFIEINKEKISEIKTLLGRV